MRAAAHCARTSVKPRCMHVCAYLVRIDALDSAVHLHFTFVLSDPSCAPFYWWFVSASAEYLDNLLYFIRDGIRPNDGCDYVVVVNQVSV